MMDCGKMENFIFEFIDQSLGRRDGEMLSVHLRQCRDCQMKMEDLLRFRASIKFHKAMEPSPVADESFTFSVLDRLSKQGAFAPQPAVAGWIEKIHSAFTPYRVRWLAPAFAIMIFLLLPLSLFEKNGSNQGEVRVPSVVNIAKQTNPIPVQPVAVQQKLKKQSELDEYLMFHAQNASQSHIGYPVIYASY